MSQALRILLIDDNQDDRFLTLRELRREFPTLQVKEILEAEGFKQALEDSFDLVVTDYQLGWSDGITLLQAIKDRYPGCPVIMFTNTGNEEIAVEAMKSGLDDYIVKAPNRYMRVPVAVRIALERVEARHTRTRLEAELSELLQQERAARTQAEEASRLKDEFLATLSHELRTPLNAMLGWAQLLRLRRLDEDGYARAIETIDRNTRSLARLIEDLLDVSRIITGKLVLDMGPVDLVTVVDAALVTIRPAAQTRLIQLNFLIDTLDSIVMGDAVRLQQVMWNLLSNAVKFTPTEGQIQVQLKQTGSNLTVSVSDTGQGISPEFLPYVFDRFRQADSSSTRLQGGLGLGLAIARHLVELHGGTIRAESQGERKGATFTFELPQWQTEARRENVANLRSQAFLPNLSLNRIRVLVVDDQADVGELVKLILEEQGAEVRVAATVNQALSIFEDFKPEVLISDIGMPSQDGYALMQHIRSLPVDQGGQIPAIALTAYAKEEDRERAIAAGFQKHIAKPVEPDELISAIADLIQVDNTQTDNR